MLSVKVSVLSTSTKFTKVVIKTKSKWRLSQNYCSIRISPDHTQMSRTQLQNVFTKHKKRQLFGETNFIFKFLKCILMISKYS